MFITGSKQLQGAIDKAIAGDRGMHYTIAKYISANYNLCMHIKEGSPEDLENETIYTKFKEEHPELHAQVEGWVDFIYYRWEHADDDWD